MNPDSFLALGTSSPLIRLAHRLFWEPGRTPQSWPVNPFEREVMGSGTDLGTSWASQALREARAYEDSDPHDLRELVELRAREILEIFPDARLDTLQPFRSYVELPDGRWHPVDLLCVTKVNVQLAVDGLEAAYLAAMNAGSKRPLLLGARSLNAAEHLFREAYNLEPLKEEDLSRPWSERLGRLVRQCWGLLLDQASELADRAKQADARRLEATKRAEKAVEQVVEEIVESRASRNSDAQDAGRGLAKTGRAKNRLGGIGGGDSGWSR